MPTYEYQCDVCNHNFDEFQSIMAKPLKKCPQCGKQKLRRVFGAGAAILFKGSGFYQTDYRSEAYKAAAKADAESSKAASGNGTTGKSDTPAAAPAKETKSESKGAKSTT